MTSQPVASRALRRREGGRPRSVAARRVAEGAEVLGRGDQHVQRVLGLRVGFGRIVALYYRSSTSYQIH